MVGPDEIAVLAARLAGPSARISTEGAGWDHVAWRVLSDDGVAWIMRAASDPATDDVAREVAVMQRARAVLGDLIADAVVLDESAGVMAYVRRPGVPLQDLLVTGRAPAAAVARLAGEVGGIIRAIGGLEPSADVPVDDGGFAAWFAELPGFVGTIEHVLTVDERAAVERFLGAPPPADPSELPLCHNDLGAEHVLVDPTTLTMTGIIDWSDAARADTAAELGRLLRDLGADHLDAVVEALQAGERRALVERAWCYARCLVLEDLAYAIRRRSDLIAFEHASLARLFAGV